MASFILQNTSQNTSFKIFIGVFFIVFGLATLVYYVGYLFFAIAIVVFWYGSGVEFNECDNKIRSFYSIFGKRFGSFIDLDRFYAVSVKKVRKGYRVYSRSNVSSIDSTKLKFEVYLMGRKTKDSILLLDTDAKEDAFSYADCYAAQFGKPVMKYGAKHKNRRN